MCPTGFFGGTTHTWGKWIHHQSYEITRGKDGGKRGEMFIQKRTCDVCGFTEYNEQSITV